MFCVDASIFLSAAHGNEIASERSKKFLEALQLEETKIFIPEIVIVEIASWLFRATKEATRVNELIEALRATPNLTFVPISGQLIDLAVDIVIKTGLKAADAIYVALAYAALTLYFGW